MSLIIVLLIPSAARADERTDAIAGELRRTGIYVTDHAPREISVEDIPRLRAILDRVPGKVFLAVTPMVGVSGEPLAAVLRDRLREDGLYLVMDESGIYLDGLQFGPEALPVKAASTATLYETPYDAGPFRRLERFVEVLMSGDAEATKRAERARDRARRDDDYPLPYRDRRDQQLLRWEAGSTLAGAIAAGGVIHGLRRRRAAAGDGGPPSAFSVVALLAGAITLALGTFAAEGSAAAASDLARRRIDRVVTGLQRSPLFVDPDLGHLLPPAERPPLEAAIRDAGIPLYVVVMPLLQDDESQGIGSAFNSALRERLGPGVYLAADEHGFIHQETFDIARDADISFDLRKSPPFDEPPAYASRLATLIDLIRQSPPGTPYSPDYEPAEPIERREQRSGSVPAGELLRSAGIGFFVAGPILGVPLYLVGLFLVGAFRAVRKARDGPAIAPAGGGLPLRTPDAPVEPSLRWLRRQAEDELAALNAELDADANLRGVSSSDRRARALSAYDATALLLGGDKEDPQALLAAVVLARDGRRALRPSRAMLAVPCAVNPLHGPAAKRRSVSLLGAPARPTPLCPDCAGLATTTRDNRTLHLEADGELSPYLSIPGLWPDDPSDATGPILAARVREHLGVH